MTAVRAVVAGCGYAAPEGRLTNADLEARVDTTDEWIVERTGIRERRMAAPGEKTSTFATAAAAAALKDAGLTPADIDMLLLATTTPDQILPATAPFVQEALGLRCGAIDVNAACAGFAYALGMGAALVETGRASNVLVIGAEVITPYVDFDDRGTCILFGDGAGACVLSRGEGDAGLLSWDVGCDGTGAPYLAVPPGDRYIRMEGSEIFRRAVRVVAESAANALEKAGVRADDVALFVPHQANIRIIQAAADRLGVPMERTMVNLDRYGNTSAASVPIALAEAREAGRLADGDLVLLAGFGAGMTWASAVLRWGR